ncbi:Cytosolic non-specific dipeptidase, partial [Acipenser ruthenus]
RLAEWVAVQSVSAWPEKRGEIKRMMEIAAKEIERLGGTVELVDIGKQKLSEGAEIPLPPIILGKLGSDPKKKTVCIYGHLDVQPADIDDGWDTEPFTLVEKDGKLFGRGSTDDKGPVLAWLNCIEAYQKTQQELPINIKFCFEGMEESGSEGLDDLIFARKDSFFKGVDYVCISDNYWLGKNKPCITYGLRGICYFFLEVECSDKDLHSGVFGGSMHEAMTDLIALMDSLVDKKGKILIPGIYEAVAPLTDEEKNLYEKIDFDMKEYCRDVGACKLLHDTKEQILMHRWRYPSLSLHGIEGAFSASGAKTVIPRKVIGKFSLRLVPDMDPNVVEKLELKEWVAIPSDSSDPQAWDKIVRMLNVTADKIKTLGGNVELADLGSQKMSNGQSVHLPPVILAELKKDPKKPTLCIYGHVDVQPAKKEDGWTTDPYTLTEINGNLYGRGASDNKGPVLAWLHAVEAYQSLKQELPVNIKFIIEGMEEAGSNGLDTLTEQRNMTFFSDVDYIVISDNIWISKKPALTYGTRGNCYFFVEEEILQHRWRYPSLSIHGIEGAFFETGTKTVIPRKVTGKFSIRLVPNMDPSEVEKQVTEYLHKVFAERNSPNQLKVTMPISAKPWLADVSDPQFVAGRRAVQTVFGVDPDLICEGSTIPIARNFQDVTGKSIMMLPIGGADDGEHSQNEKMSREMTRHAATEKHKLKSQAYLLKLKETAEVLPVETTAKCGEEEEHQEESLDETQQESPSESVSAKTTGMKNDTIVTGVTVENRNIEESARSPLESEASEGNNLEKSRDLHSGGSGTKTGEGQIINIKVIECKEGDIPEKAQIDVQNETDEAVKDSVWKTDESITEGLQGVDSDIELQESNLAGQSQTKELSRAVKFDASIVLLKNYSDVEYTDYDAGQSSEGLASDNKNLQPVRKKRRSSQIEKPRIRCEDCGFLADGLSGLNVHISMKHPTKEKTFHCLLCGKSFYTESNLHQHLTSAGHLRNEQASIEELPEGGATFKCVKCTDPFNSEQELFMHIKEKHEELLREVNKYILEDTEQINNEREENRGNVCKYCGKICKSSNSMAFLAHIRTHTDTEEVPAAEKENSDSDGENATNQSQRMFCVVCRKYLDAADKTSPLFAGSKPFKCKLCKFATAQLGDARNHVKRHLGMREYKCHVCG